MIDPITIGISVIGSIAIAYLFATRITPLYVVNNLQTGLDAGEFDEILEAVLGRMQEKAVILVANGVHTYLSNAQKEAGKKMRMVEDEVKAELFEVDPVTALLSEVVPPKYRKYLTKAGAVDKVTKKTDSSNSGGFVY